jgi:hypothetical protein
VGKLMAAEASMLDLNAQVYESQKVHGLRFGGREEADLLAAGTTRRGQILAGQSAQGPDGEVPGLRAGDERRNEPVEVVPGLRGEERFKPGDENNQDISSLVDKANIRKLSRFNPERTAGWERGPEDKKPSIRGGSQIGDAKQLKQSRVQPNPLRLLGGELPEGRREMVRAPSCPWFPLERQSAP